MIESARRISTVGRVGCAGDLTYTEHPVKILETSERVTRNKRIKMCRVQWSHHSEAEATWEREDELKKTYPDLFASQPS